jgi:hypothetical protein
MPSNVIQTNILNCSVEITCGISVNTMNQVMRLNIEKSGLNCSYVYEILSSSKCLESKKMNSEYSTECILEVHLFRGKLANSQI